MISFIKIACWIFLLNLSCINSELKCNFREFLDASSIYTCELVSSTAIVDDVHMPGKSNDDVKSIKFDGFGAKEIFNNKLQICQNYKNLEIVKLFSAGIADLDQNSFTQCKNLRFLSLASNKISRIPENLFTGNSKLTTLSLEQNNLSTLPENVFANLKDLSDLNLSKNKIENLPFNIFTPLINLRVLKLNSNKIQSIIHNWFRNLRKLEDLDLSNNLISNIGERNFQFLTNLRSLQLSQNKIEELQPNVLHNLNKLQELNLDFNKISSPSAKAFELLTNLKKLSFGSNGIIDLPENIFNTLKNLEELKLWRNQLSTIHLDSFGTHNDLFLIDLEDNNIHAIDPSLIDNLDVFRIFMDGNFCYQGELEEKIEMIEELKDCFDNYEPRQTLVESSTSRSTKPYFPLITETFYITTSPMTSLPTTSEFIPETTTTRQTRSTTHFRTRRTTTITRRTTTTTGFTTTQRTTTEFPAPPYFPLPTYFPPLPTRKTTTTPKSTTAASFWNLLEPKNIPTCGRPKMKISAEVSGGQVRQGAFPWTAALIRNDGQLFCGGILVSKNLVVTAAHCIEGKKRHYVFKTHDFFIMLGAHNVKQSYEKGRTTVNVKTIHIHNDWNPYIDQYDADIAIIELEVEVKFNRFIQPICIPEAGSIPATKDYGIVVGFGKSEFADIQDIARLVPVPIHDNRKCHSSHDTFQLLLSHRGFCGGFANGTGVCTGDSGSGLIVIHDGVYYLRGIVSASLYGPLSGCNLNAYSVFTDVLEFTGWIKIGRDDKTLIQLLIERLRKCEAQKGTTEKVHVEKHLERSNDESWRVIFPENNS